MLPLINGNRSLLDEHDFTFVAKSPMVYQCHHVNLFFDQTIDDALGVERGIRIRTHAAYEASSQFLNAFINALPPTTPEERLDLAGTIFAALGHGSIELDATPSGGTATGRHLHYGAAWKDVYGATLRRRHPADAVTAGYIAAAIEAAYGLPFGSVECIETACVATGAKDHCGFMIEESGEANVAFGVTKDDIAGNVPRSFHGLHEERIVQMVTGLREFLASTGGDRRGLIPYFGGYFTQHLANYYNHCLNRTLDILAEEKPGAVTVARDLMRECGQLCGFHTFGGILMSPEWEALVSAVRGEPLEVIEACLATARALGFGHWSLEAFEPGKTLILRSPATYESVYRKVAYPLEEGGCCYMYQGAALSMMQLAHRISWTERPALTRELYTQLRKDMPWKVEETHCVAAGNSICRVVVESA